MCCAQIPDSPPIHSPPVVGEDVELTRNEAYGDILFKSNPADECHV
jgi:hypothetical protein